MTRHRPSRTPPLPLDDVLRNLQQKSAERAAALEEFAGTRVYRMQYRGVPSDRDAEMVVTMSYHAPDKQFSVVSQTGSKFIVDHIFMKLLEGEREAASEENRRRTALSTQNYDFSLAGYESSPEGGRYILNLLPKTKNKFLYCGKVWVDAKDFAVVRIEGEPGKNPSFWIKKDRNCSPVRQSEWLLASRRKPHGKLSTARRTSDPLHRVSGLQDHKSCSIAC